MGQNGRVEPTVTLTEHGLQPHEAAHKVVKVHSQVRLRVTGDNELVQLLVELEAWPRRGFEGRGLQPGPRGQGSGRAQQLRGMTTPCAGPGPPSRESAWPARAQGWVSVLLTALIPTRAVRVALDLSQGRLRSQAHTSLAGEPGAGHLPSQSPAFLRTTEIMSSLGSEDKRNR